VDLIYYGNQGHLEYDVRLAPGAKRWPSAVALSRVAQKRQLDAQGTRAILSHGRN